MHEDLPLLLFLSKKTDLGTSIHVSTTQIAEELKVSQQTVSRKLRELEERGWIYRHVSLTGTTIQISEKGKEMLDETYIYLKSIFENTKNTNIKKQKVEGQVFEGIGEGKFYMQLEWYVQQFVKKLGFKPYPGTLNLRVAQQQVHDFLKTKPHLFIEGFTTKERTYGGIDCYPLRLTYKNKSMSTALIIPVRTHHPKNVAEIIAPLNLRSHFKLHNGSEVFLL